MHITTLDINYLLFNIKLVLFYFYRMDKVLHVFDDENIDRLNVLLANHNSFEALATIGKQNGSSEAVWLIHVTNATESFLLNIFRKTPLRLDSQTYAITQKGIRK